MTFFGILCNELIFFILVFFVTCRGFTVTYFHFLETNLNYHLANPNPSTRLSFFSPLPVFLNDQQRIHRMFCCAVFEQILLKIRHPICFIFKWVTSCFFCDAESLILLLSFIPNSLCRGNMFYCFTLSYSAVQSISQVKKYNLSQKAEIQTTEPREHLLQPNHKVPSPVSSSSG